MKMVVQKSIALIGLAILSACETDGNSRVKNLARLMPPAQQANFPLWCEVSPTFPNLPRATHTPLEVVDGEYYGWEYEDANVNLQAHCNCRENFTPSFASEYDVRYSFDRDAQIRQAKISEIKIESYRDGKMARVELHRQQSPVGPLKGITNAYYLRKCFVSVSAVFKVGDARGEEKSNYFLSSIRPIASPPANPSSPNNSVSPGVSVEQRLEVLRDLRARGLINSEEYDRRRKAIIDAL